MILLDTNYLIRVLVAETAEADQLEVWLARGTEFCTSAISWYEFLSGPVDAEGVDIIRSLVSGRILPFTPAVAAEAARLFNAVGRARRYRVDAMIAATAIIANASVVSANIADFRLFADYGLSIA